MDKLEENLEEVKPVCLPTGSIPSELILYFPLLYPLSHSF